MYGRRLRHLSEDQLRQEIATMAEDLYRMQQELNSRSGENRVMYECEECGIRNANMDVIYDHLLNVHNYPEEDAGISTLEVYV